MNNSLPNPNNFKDYKATYTAPKYYNTLIKSNTQTLIEVAKEFNSFDTLSNEHKTPLEELFPLWLYDESNTADMDYFCYLVRFDKKYNSLVVAIVDEQINIISYKHRKKKKVKWCTRYATSPNSTLMQRVHTDEPIYIVEGVRDFLAGILLGLNIIGIPTASYKGSLPIRKDDDLVFTIEDSVSMLVMERLANECKSIAKSIKMVRWSDNASKIDLSDVCFKFNSIEEVRNELK